MSRVRPTSSALTTSPPAPTRRSGSSRPRSEAGAAVAVAEPGAVSPARSPTRPTCRPLWTPRPMPSSWAMLPGRTWEPDRGTWLPATVACPPGLHDDKSVGPVAPDLAKKHPEYAILRSQSGSAVPLLEDGQLLAQGEVLDHQFQPGPEQDPGKGSRQCPSQANHATSIAGERPTGKTNAFLVRDPKAHEINHYGILSRDIPTLLSSFQLYSVDTQERIRGAAYSTVTLLAKLRGLSTSQPRATAIW